ncbi:MAG TPA: 4Fe-4S binding protein [Methanothermococcus okinawensis]|nr:4Fe-4S binding protein [Methanothermococcus okinawensis]
MNFKELFNKVNAIIPIFVKYGIFIGVIPTVIFVIFRCPYMIPFLACDMCPVVDCPSKYYRRPFVAFVIGYMFLFRKDFCSGVCPFGTLNDIIYKVKRKISKSVVKLPLELKLSFNFLRYTIFAFAIIAIINGNPRYYIPIHTGDLITSIELTLMTAGNEYYTRLLLVFGGLLLAILIPRFWCRFLCPYGTAIQLTKKGIKKTKNKLKCNSKCDKCGNHD